jgi:hypothetical protein
MYTGSITATMQWCAPFPQAGSHHAASPAVFAAVVSSARQTNTTHLFPSTLTECNCRVLAVLSRCHRPCGYGRDERHYDTHPTSSYGLKHGACEASTQSCTQEQRHPQPVQRVAVLSPPDRPRKVVLCVRVKPAPQCAVLAASASN